MTAALPSPQSLAAGVAPFDTVAPLDGDARTPAGAPPAGAPAGVALDAVGEVAVVRCSGDLDLAALPTVAAGVAETLETRPTGLVLDLSDVTFCDTSGLRLLLSTAAKGRAQGCAVGVAGAQPGVADLLARVCADRALLCYDDVADAIEGLMFAGDWR